MTWLPLAKPDLTDAENAAQERVLRSGRLVLGPANEAFEERVAKVAERAHAVACSSGTAALHLALWARGLPRGGRVLVPAFTFPAPANGATLLGLEVAAVDVDPATWNVSAEAVERARTPDTVAVIVVDQFGLPASPDVRDAAAGLFVVEDAACAIGAQVDGRAAGSLGDVATFSFHPRKVVTTGEGGVAVTDDDDLARRMRALRNHGQVAPGQLLGAGLNLRLGEASAAVGVVQMDRLAELLGARAALARRYRTAICASRLAGRLRMQEPPPGARHIFQTFAVLLEEGMDRAAAIAGLRERDIESGPATYALHALAPYTGRPGFSPADLPVADALHRRALALPLFSRMRPDDVDRVVRALEEVLP